MVDLMDTHVEDRNRVQPHHANNLGTAHGGNVLQWMDEAAAMSANRFAGAPCVTAHISSIDFERPLELGDIALVQSYVYGSGTTSVKVRARVHGEDPFSGDSEVTTESYFVFVAIDPEGDPISVPDLTVSSDEATELRSQALSNE